MESRRGVVFVVIFFIIVTIISSVTIVSAGVNAIAPLVLADIYMDWVICDSSVCID